MFGTALPEVGQVIIDFLDAYLVRDTNAGRLLSVDGNRPALVALRSG
jgi:hypothetical protein